MRKASTRNIKCNMKNIINTAVLYIKLKEWILGILIIRKTFFFFLFVSIWDKGLPIWYNSKESACQCRRCKRHGFNPWIRKIPWSRKWQPTPVFLPGKFHGQRSLLGYSDVAKSQTWLSNWTCTYMRQWQFSKLIVTISRCMQVKSHCTV